jgi:uncharacterized protein (DUF1330 family)
MPKAYVVAMLEITNPEGMGPYLGNVGATIAAHGGRYLVKSMGEKLYTENDPNPVTVVLEFPDKEAVMAWKNSAEYQKILSSRLDNSHGPLVICEGLE